MERHDIHLAINDALLTYCRGVDRLDAATILSAFHPGAQLIDYGPEPTTIEAFAERVVVSLGERFVRTQHRVSNVRIELEPSMAAAKVEAYVLAFHVQEVEGVQKLYTFNGRYIDRQEQRDGAWKISRRHLRVDWSRVETIDATMGGAWVPSGRAGSPDPVWD